MREIGARQFIYFASMPNGLIKVGSSSQVKKRLAALKADLIHLIEGSCFRETALHFVLRDSYVANECFHDDDNVRSFIAGTKIGDYRGLITDLPRVCLWRQPDACKYKLGVVRPFHLVREALGISHDEAAAEVGGSTVTLRSADSQTAPYDLSGKLVQWIVGRAREREIWLDSHHFTGLYTADLTGLLPKHAPELSRAA